MRTGAAVSGLTLTPSSYLPTPAPRWWRPSGHGSDSLSSLPQEGVQLGLGGRQHSPRSRSLLSLGLGLDGQWADHSHVSLKEPSRKRCAAGTGMQPERLRPAGRQAALLHGARPDCAHLRLQPPAGWGLGAQVRDGTSSLPAQPNATEQGYRLDEFCPASKPIKACPYLKQKDEVSGPPSPTRGLAPATCGEPHSPHLCCDRALPWPSWAASGRGRCSG